MCKDEVSVILVFVPYKIGSMFSTNNKIPSYLKSMVVYKFVCASWNACYVGETAKHLPTKIKKHLKTDKGHTHTSIFHQIITVSTDDCFSTMDNAWIEDKGSPLHKMVRLHFK